MTRINLVPVQELSDQWLIAEYRELPRAIKGRYSLLDAPLCYKLGKGHVKWANKHGLFVSKRYVALQKEMRYRGFKTNYNEDLSQYLKSWMLDYKPNANDITLSKERLQEKYKANPIFYRWTKREKPSYL